MSNKPSGKSYSFWALFNLYDVCPFSYGLAKDEHADGVRFPDKLIQPTFLGTVFHKLMEEKIRKVWSWKDCRMELPGLTRLVADEEHRYTASTRRCSLTTKHIFELLDELNPLAKKLIGGAVKAEENVGAEIAPGVRIHGRVDLIGQLPLSSGKLVNYTVDYKCGRSLNPKVATQCVFYHLCGAPNKAFVIYPVLNEVKPVDISPKRKEKIRVKAIQLVEGVESGNREQNLKACARCFYGKYKVNDTVRQCPGYVEKLKEWKEYYGNN